MEKITLSYRNDEESKELLLAVFEAARKCRDVTKIKGKENPSGYNKIYLHCEPKENIENSTEI